MEACGGSGGNADGGPDATSNDAPASDTFQGDVSNDVSSQDASDAALTCPTYNGAVTLCNAEVARCNACGSTLNACQTANYATLCGDYANVFSQAYAAAASACATTCDTDADTACTRAFLADASLTTAQTTPATDYCTECESANVAVCVKAFENNFSLLDYSDTVCNTIASACTPDAATDAACAPAKYGTCAEEVIVGLIPTICADAGGD
jgi:hypothetical protein